MNFTTFCRLLLVVVSVVACCNGSKPSTQHKASYTLVKDWLQTGIKQPGQVTGIGIDTAGNVVIFHRAGRIWA